MKKMKLNPLQLNKETIALLDAKQLRDVVGGANTTVGVSGSSTGCGSGSSTCKSGGSTGCGSGSSTCFATYGN